MPLGCRPPVGQYRCLWRHCSFVSGNDLVFYRHVDGHWRNAATASCDDVDAATASRDDTDAATASRANVDAITVSRDGIDVVTASRDDTDAATTCRCLWSDCEFTTNDSDHFCRHVLYHAYHAKLVQSALVELAGKRAPPQCGLTPLPSPVPDLSRPFVCQWHECGLQLNEPTTFFAHVQHHLTMEERDGRKLRTAMCLWAECGRHLSTASMARSHAYTHTGERMFACEQCGRQFSTFPWLLHHLWRQAGELRRHWQCSRCRLRFGSHHQLRQHVKTHTARVQCRFCGLFYCTALLDTHIRRVHTGVAKFRCAVCSAGFQYRSGLAEHARRHVPTTSHQHHHRCSHPGCSFSHRHASAVRHHIAVRHEGRKRVFACHRCPAEFVGGSGVGSCLTHHLRRHHPNDLPANMSRIRYTRRADGRYSLHELDASLNSYRQQVKQEQQEEGVCVPGVVCVRRLTQTGVAPRSITLADGRCCTLAEPTRRLLAEGFDVLLAPSGPDRRQLRLLSVTCGLPLQQSSEGDRLVLQLDSSHASLLGVSLFPLSQH